MILVVVSAITLGIVNSNRDFDEIREYLSAPQSIKQLEDLVDSTESTSAWLILLSIIVVVWQALYSVLLLMSSRLSFLQRYSVVLAITVRPPAPSTSPSPHTHSLNHPISHNFRIESVLHYLPTMTNTGCGPQFISRCLFLGHHNRLHSLS